MILLEDFDFNKSTLTCKTMEFYGSDKGSVEAGKGWHNYTIVYNKLFSHRFHETLRIFELGIGTTNPTIRSNMGIKGKPGASLYGWRDLFPNSSIFAADIDKNILFEDDRIKTMYCDQTSKESIQNLWKSSALEEDFDIIIEDGLHTFQANVTFFENSIHKLRKNGYYIIEDIHDNDIVKFNTIIKTWEKTYPHLEFSLLKLPLSQNKQHNTLLVIHYKANTTKNLVYFCVFFNPDYFKLAELLLKSTRFYSGTQIKLMDFLVITAEEFIPRVKDLSTLTEIPLLIHTLPLKTIFESACARLRIFDYPLLNTYEKILYIDTDILIKGDLGKLFEFALEERVYAIESGTIASPSFGRQFFSESMDKSIKGFNSGTLLFPNSLNIRDLFSKIRGHCESYADSKAPIPYCMDQPFINYHCIKSGLYNNTLLNPYVALFEDGDNVSNEATAIVCHFSYPIGNVWHKHARMTKYFTKLLEARRKGLVGDIDIRGKIYSWGSGFIEFTDTGIKTKWGSGGYESLGENWYKVYWSNHYHVIRLNAELTEYKGLRIHPNDFTVCRGSLKSLKTIIQIGSHVGKSRLDPIFLDVNEKTKLFLVEPVPFLFKQLQDNYRNKMKDTSNIVFINKAVSNFVGEIEMTIPSEKNDFSVLPDWVSELASINPDHVTRHLSHVITEKIKVETTTLDKIINDYNIQDIELLNTDTEGHDYTILMDYSFRIKPQRVLFEHKHIDGIFCVGENFTKLGNRLKSLGYKQTYQTHNDTMFELHENIFEDRESMLQHYCKTIPNPKILEIGIFKGEFLDYLVQNSGASSIDGVDLFEGITFSGDVDGNNSISYDVGKSYIDLTEKYKNNPAVRLYKSDSSTFLASVADNKYDIIYIDGDHSYEGSKKDLEQSFKKIKNGGYIMGHDYEMNMKKAKTTYNFGVKQAVDEFCEKYNQILLAKAMDGCVSFCIHIQKSSDIENSLIDKILEKKLTLVSKERLLNLEKHCGSFINTNYSLVECGVAKGGCLALMKAVAGKNNRIFGFDSFEGMPDITDKDLGSYNKSDPLLGFGKVGENLSGGIENVYKTFESLNVSMNNVKLVKGFFNETLKNDIINSIGPIAVLRLDGDWYESTRVCLEKLYEKVIVGGVIIIDDYGHWIGAKRATDEFRENNNITSPLIKTDYTEHYWIK